MYVILMLVTIRYALCIGIQLNDESQPTFGISPFGLFKLSHQQQRVFQIQRKRLEEKKASNKYVSEKLLVTIPYNAIQYNINSLSQ